MTSVRRPRVVLAPDAFKGNHDSVQVAAAWAEALAEEGRKEEALTHLRYAVRLNPQDGHAKEVLEKVEKGE